MLSSRPKRLQTRPRAGPKTWFQEGVLQPEELLGSVTKAHGLLSWAVQGCLGFRVRDLAHGKLEAEPEMNRTPEIPRPGPRDPKPHQLPPLDLRKD